ncbi:MAG: hypothetical protein ABW278_14355 [Steroidobacteraceae bacterium]
MTLISRRAVLHGVGGASAFSAVAAALPGALFAADEAASESDILLSIVYPNAPKAEFDAKRYEGKHIPLLKSLYGDSIERVELRVPRKISAPGRRAGISNVPSQPAPMGPPPAVLASASIWIRNLKDFAARSLTVNAQILEDLKQVTSSEPIVQYDRVVSLLGDDSSAIQVDGQVFSTYFPTREGATFDAKYYGEKVIPLMIKLYGAKSIRRVQYTLGVKQGEAAPALTAAAHFYIRDRAAWDAAGMQAYPQLAAEGPHYTTIRPWVADQEVVAVA